MPRKRVISLCPLILLSCSILVAVYSGCSVTKETVTDKTVDNETPVSTTREISYRTYEMKPDDRRLEFLDHPLFSFEYPEIFPLIDRSKMTGPWIIGVSDVNFIARQADLPEIDLNIRIMEYGAFDYNNANVVFDAWIVTAESHGDTISTGERVVSRIKGNYIETSGTRPAYRIAGKLMYPERQQLFRGVVFDYKDLIWSISLTWPYSESAPHEIGEYFDHIIETFRILE